MGGIGQRPDEPPAGTSPRQSLSLPFSPHGPARSRGAPALSLDVHTHHERPRDVRWFQAGAMLYGDWGTSRLYVLGLAFWFSTRSSFYYLVGMSLLILVVAWAYGVICRLYPDGGGVYSAAKRVSPTLAVFGALLLSADYVVTASISSLSAFQYFGVERPILWASVSLAGIGILNAFGPRRVGNIALVVAMAAMVLTFVLVGFAVPHLGSARVEAPGGSLLSSWKSFVEIVLALSGVEAIANMTGVMVRPVERTARRAIWPVALEVAGLNLLLGLAMLAIPDLDPQYHKEDMVAHLADHFVGPGFATVASLVFGVLLLSAANTAIGGFVSVLYVLSRDKEMPARLSRLNRYGVPAIPILVATVVPIVVLLVEGDLVQLSALYAIGVVGAITINLGTCAYGKGLVIPGRERLSLAALALFMAVIEVTVAATKANALVFVAIVLSVGFALRYATRLVPQPEVAELPEAQRRALVEEKHRILVAARGPGLLPFAFEEAAKRNAAIFLLFVREIVVRTTDPAAVPLRKEEDPEALRLFTEATEMAALRGRDVIPIYATTSESPADLILETAASLGVEALVMGASQRSRFYRLFKGDVVSRIARYLPPGITLVLWRQ
jgi:amino acid transporter